MKDIDYAELVRIRNEAFDKLHWIMSRNTFNKIRKVHDSAHSYAWSYDMDGNGKVLGFNVIISEDQEGIELINIDQLKKANNEE